MKLVHSNIVHEPESQSFELDESDLFTPVYNSQIKKLNSVCVDLKRNEWELEDCMTTPKVEFSDRVIDFKGDYQAQVKDIVKDICVDEGVPTKDKFLFEMGVDEKAYDLFPCNEDKELKKDNIGINVLNLPATDQSSQVLLNREQSQDLMCKDEAVTQKHCDIVNNETLPGVMVLLQVLEKQEPTDSDGQNFLNHAQSNDLTCNDEAVTQKVCDNVNKATSPGVMVLSQELGKQEPGDSDGHDEQVLDEPESLSRSLESESIVDEGVLTTPTLAPAIVESNSDNVLKEKVSFTYMLNPPVLGAACGKEECHQLGGCKCKESQDTSEPADGKSNDVAVLSLIHNSLGETSFSGVGHGSSRINYSGPVPYSGSISLRSESSTTSTRSFAFPVVPSEWNSSPVRMAKADKSNYRKHRGWRQGLGLLCCRF
ncbi:hypothetical protein TanjilG_06767 [Lupinus angustifolius]|uniref:18S pre-ribosomal assembly protein gar2-like protein n=1 Tax=Lupinus angustifolius TaxID=3871 RepID=A0A1J7HSH5_LUPAN|nr:PREDICTED: uncharacterized protein LOC109357461 isoform X2 [Lupinus angustifolius]XP_019456975.1 PREDICTED: uncharacterized protein LOC109357461 isoform X2 [Lupinus angustifolius]XP_019456976.1 PREDICTED: uncharacterized protein LOC109357461 isoform X2 [Lupinus angustifolius]OIW04701.1 hypothetical protein TanjilG_06767 [Lupinus angustifolius]